MRITTAAWTFASTIACGLAVSGCAINPQPKDVTGVSTFVIEQQIRCETRKAVIDLALTYAASRPETRETAERYMAEVAADPGGATSLSPADFSGEVRRSLEVFWTTGVAYNFKLDMQEIDNADGELDVGSLFARRAFGIAFKAGLDRSRENTRTFTVTDTFGGLVKSLTGCGERIVGPNYIYPISGEIGVKDMIQDFVYMTIFGNLGGQSQTPATVPKGPPTLVDALLFTTTISGSVNPHVAFSPVHKDLGVTAANVNFAASRIDKHQVVVGLALAVKAQKPLGVIRNAYFAPTFTSPAAGAPLVAPLLTASPLTGSEAIATAAVNQYLTQQLFSPTINLPP